MEQAGLPSRTAVRIVWLVPEIGPPGCDAKLTRLRPVVVELGPTDSRHSVLSFLSSRPPRPFHCSLIPGTTAGRASVQRRVPPSSIRETALGRGGSIGHWTPTRAPRRYRLRQREEKTKACLDLVRAAANYSHLRTAQLPAHFSPTAHTSTTLHHCSLAAHFCSIPPAFLTSAAGGESFRPFQPSPRILRAFGTSPCFARFLGHIIGSHPRIW